MSILNYVLLDCDVFRHFHRGGQLEVLPKLFPNSLVILDTVKGELLRSKSLQYPVTMFLSTYKIPEINFPAEVKYITEYASLISKMRDEGESACMVYAKFNSDFAIASSNLKDIEAYCVSNKIPFVTTMDILVMANKKHIISVDDCNKFITQVKSTNSRLPVNSLQEYVNDYPLREINIAKTKK